MTTAASHTTHRRPQRSAAELLVEVFNIRRCRQASPPHFIRADIHLAGLTIFNVLASSSGVAWPRKHGDPVVAIADEALRRRLEQALREAARQENAHTEVPA